MLSFFLRCLIATALVPASRSLAADATFFRAVNLNGPAVTIEGRAWEGDPAKDFAVTGKTFANQNIPLRPATDSARAQMIRSSRWGDKVDATFSNVPPGTYQVFLHVWEDNQSERFKLLVNGQVVVEEFYSGTTGMWKRLGPWRCESAGGKITVSARAASHGAANLSGVELWSGDGPVPGVAGAAFADAPTADQLAFFESKIRPVLVERCYECHSAKAAKIKGGLMLDSRAGVMKGGDSGPAITPGDADASLLIQAVRHVSEDVAMPPKKKLPPEQLAALEQWVKMGAPDPRTEDTVAAVQAKYAIDWKTAREWWSFRPLAKAGPPAVKDTAWPVNDVDRFILARIEAAGGRPAPDADPRVLIRRITYDLTGLPPTPEEVSAFVEECRDGSSFVIRHSSLAALVERLLASPAYGEAWGRHWLDVVRYADTAGDNSDFPIPQMARYRDWVIAAFNRDLPYDQFVQEQLAGDLLPNRAYDQLIATGYIANSRRFGSRVDDYPQHLTIEDTIDNLGRTFLGLTINCARCHDHKFDPITQQDYYALYGIFHSTRYPWPGIELDQKQRDLVPLAAPAEIEAATKLIAEHDKESRRLEKEKKRLEDDLKKKQGDEKKTLERELATVKAAAQEHARKRPAFDLAYAVSEAKNIQDAAVQMKGDPAKPGPVVPRRFLTVFGGAEIPADDKSSGRRRLVAWILNDSRALAARVMVNRIWAQHFGRGLVPTPNDFGKQGKPCTHPELLDWLAARFISGGWSVKKLHREILLSRTYRLAGPALAAEGKPQDAELFAHFPRRRLEAEAIRDTLLVLGGTLDRTPGGMHPFPPPSEWKFTQHNPFKAVYESAKRSVYLMTQRIQRHPYLAIFDGADPSASTPARMTSTTPLQALFLLNDPLVHEQSKRFAARIVAEVSDDRARLGLAYELALGRPPGDDELIAGLSFLAAAKSKTSAKSETEAWQAMARVIFRLNELIYLD
jgi:Protein of unknown function (DUF1549)/Protein of unknown function (DUF1553)/Planctomycete cytochrome C